MTQTLVPNYEDLASEVEEFYQKISAQELDDFQPIRNCAQKLLEAAQKEGADLFELACHPFEDKPMARHVVHTAILSVMLGLSLKFNPEKLLGLAEAALLFDVGMTALWGKELKDIRKHPEHGAKELTRFSDCPPEVSQAVAQHHERFDGSGYPKGLKEDQIHLFARVIGLADTFCNLIHVTPGQRRLSLYEAIQELLRGRNLFDKKCLKMLFEHISFYPKGTWVILSTGERGRVTDENPGSTLRPVVEVLDEEEPDDLTRRRSIDLRKATAIYVKRVLLAEELAQKGIQV